MWERRVLQQCRWVEILYYLDLVLVGPVIAWALEEVGWMEDVVVADVGLEGIVEEWIVEEWALSILFSKDDFSSRFSIIARAWKHTNSTADIYTEYSMEEIVIALLSCIAP